MKKKQLIVLILLIINIFLNIACESDEKIEDKGLNHVFSYILLSNPQTLDPQIATDEASYNVIENTFLGLFTINEEGNLDLGVTSKYFVSEDGLKYHFYLREDCFWYTKNQEKQNVTANDFVFAFKRIFNPETMSTFREEYKCIKNASDIIDGKLNYDEIGVHAISEFVLEIELDYPNADLPYLLSKPASMPCSESFFKQTKGRYGLDDESTISNGAFYIKKWFYDPYGWDNVINMLANPENEDALETAPNGLNFYIKKDYNENYKMFEDDLIECYVSDKIKDKKIEYKEYESSLIGVTFNPEKKLTSDKNFKSAMAMSFDSDKYSHLLTQNLSIAKEIVSPQICIAGDRYRSFDSIDEIGFDLEKSKEKMEKLKKSYDDFPEVINIIVYDSIDSGFLNHVVDQWNKNLGIYVGIEYLTKEEYDLKIENGEYDLALTCIKPYGSSPYDFLSYFNNDKVIEKLLNEARLNVEVENSVSEYYSIEKKILENIEIIPLFYKKDFLIQKNGIEDIIYNPFTKQINFRYAKYKDRK